MLPDGTARQHCPLLGHLPPPAHRAHPCLHPLGFLRMCLVRIRPSRPHSTGSRRVPVPPSGPASALRTHESHGRSELWLGGRHTFPRAMGRQGTLASHRLPPGATHRVPFMEQDGPGTSVSASGKPRFGLSLRTQQAFVLTPASSPSGWPPQWAEARTPSPAMPSAAGHQEVPSKTARTFSQAPDASLFPIRSSWRAY